MSNQEMADHLHNILMEKAAMGMGVVAGARRKRSGSKAPKKRASSKKNCKVRAYRRKCRAGEGELEDIMELYGRGYLRKGSKSAKQAARNNPWVNFIRDYAEDAGISYKEALQSRKAHSAYCSMDPGTKSCGSKRRVVKKRVVKKRVVKRNQSKSSKKVCAKGKKLVKTKGYVRRSGKRIKAYERCVK